MEMAWSGAAFLACYNISRRNEQKGDRLIAETRVSAPYETIRIHQYILGLGYLRRIGPLPAPFYI